MILLTKFIRQVVRAVQKDPDAKTLTIDAKPAKFAAKWIAERLKTVSAHEKKKGKAGRPITKTDRKAEATRARVRLHRAIKKENQDGKSL